MSITLELKEQDQKLLNELAAESGVPVGQFALEHFVSMLQREHAVRKASDYVLDKNRELYERLAK